MIEASEERLGGDYEEVYIPSEAETSKHVDREESFLRLAEERVTAP
ncbi:MAG: hypothetical protein ABSF25_12775 [Bryobacteraceae bacterium]